MAEDEVLGGKLYDYNNPENYNEESIKLNQRRYSLNTHGVSKYSLEEEITIIFSLLIKAFKI